MNPLAERACFSQVGPLGRTDLPASGIATCAICLDDMRLGEATDPADKRHGPDCAEGCEVDHAAVAVLECLHFFHKSCVDEGMQQAGQQQGRCPQCRRQVF